MSTSFQNRKTDKESTTENPLCTPLTLTATAAELDQDLARDVVSLSRSYQRSAANIREIEEQHAAAVKAAGEERKNEKARKAAATPAKTAPRSDNDSKAAPGGKPVFGSKGQSAAAPTTQSLFDTPGGEAKGVPGKNEFTVAATAAQQREPESRAGAADGEPPAQQKSATTSPIPSAPGIVEAGSSSHPVEEDESLRLLLDSAWKPLKRTTVKYPRSSSGLCSTIARRSWTGVEGGGAAIESLLAWQNEPNCLGSANDLVG